MKFIHQLFLLLFLNLVYLPAEASGSAGVDITEEYAKFYFPIYEEEDYKWHKSSTIDGSLEYSIAINVGVLQAGYYLFKYPGAKQKSGSLLELLNNGQKSVWISDDDEESINSHTVDVFYSKPYMVISITNPETLRFMSTFKKASFVVQGFRSYETVLNITLP